MDNNLSMIIELQDAVSTIERLEQLISDGPSILEEIDRQMKEEEDKFLSKTAKLDSLQKERRQQEGDLQLLNSKLEKYKDQLMAVKSNKEYTAMLHEIELCEKEIEKLEEDIIVKMYEIDSLQNEVKSSEEDFKKTKKALEDKKENTEQSIDNAEKEIESLKIKKEELEKALPEDLLKKFSRILTIRDGLAIARAQDGICQACKIRIRPQVYIEIKSGSELISCDNCDRFLYWSEETNAKKDSESKGNEATTS